MPTLTAADRAVLAYTYQLADEALIDSLPSPRLRVLAAITPETPCAFTPKPEARRAS